MHLAGQSHTGNFVRPDVGAAESFAYRNPAGTPPVLGLLFGPTDLGRGKRRVFFGRRGQQVPLLIEDEGARAASSNVNSDEPDGSSPSVEDRSLCKTLGIPWG
jgi:hypothetical protein